MQADVDAPGGHSAATRDPAADAGPRRDDQPVAAGREKLKGNANALAVDYPEKFEIDGKEYSISDPNSPYSYYEDGSGGFRLHRREGSDAPKVRIKGKRPDFEVVKHDDVDKPDARFDEGTTHDQAFEALTGPDSSSSFREYFKVLEDRGIATREDILAAMGEPSGAKVGDIRHALKQKYRKKLFELTLKENGAEVDIPRSRELMQEIADQLSLKDRTSLHEEWVDHWHLPPDAVAQSSVPKQGDMAGRRQFDYLEVHDGVATEVKSHKNELSKDDKAQFEDYMKAIDNGHSVVDKSGQPHPVREVVYAFTNEQGARANAAWIREQLKAHPNLTVHVHGADGRQHSFKYQDRAELNRVFGTDTDPDITPDGPRQQHGDL